MGIEGRIDFCDIERVNLVVHLIEHNHALERQKPERFVSAGTRNKCRVHHVDIEGQIDLVTARKPLQSLVCNLFRVSFVNVISRILLNADILEIVSVPRIVESSYTDLDDVFRLNSLQFQSPANLTALGILPCRWFSSTRSR